MPTCTKRTQEFESTESNLLSMLQMMVQEWRHINNVYFD